MRLCVKCCHEHHIQKVIYRHITPYILHDVPVNYWPLVLISLVPIDYASIQIGSIFSKLLEKRDLVIIYYLVVFQHLPVSFFVVLIVIEVISDVVTIIFQERIRQDQIILFEIVSKSIPDSPHLVGPLAVVIQDDPAYLLYTITMFHVVGFCRRFIVLYLVVHNVLRDR